MKISVAAVPYFWSKESYQNFYQRLAETPVDIVYLGETVCSKRRTMKLQDWLDIAKRLLANGKQVVLSTMTLIEASSELSYLGKIASQSDFLIEANDMAAIRIAVQHQHKFCVGSNINIYNNRSLTLFAKKGMTRWVIPVELGKDDLRSIIPTAKHLDVELEYQVFGRMPLAFSARCFTARHYDLPKDDCQFKCLENEQGIKIKTQEGDSFAQINGIQTQSAKVINLLDRWRELQSSGIDILRIVPVNANDTITVVEQLHLLVNQFDSSTKMQRLENNYEYCNGYWLQIEGMALVE